MPALTLELLPDFYAVLQLPAGYPLPPALQALLSAPCALASLTSTPEETSLLLPDTAALAPALPACARIEPNWRALRVQGVLPFALVGILSSLLSPLASAGVSVFTLSTFNTDILLVKQDSVPAAARALQAAGHALLPPPRVRQATGRELPLIRARWHEAWGDGRALAELQAEEAHLDAHAFSASARRHYVLDAPELGAEEGAFVCSCEVLLTPVVVPTGKDAPCAWHIACLYTPPQHRGQGHASALLQGLRALAGPAPLLLYSDIGTRLYEGLGFHVCAGGGGAAAQDLVLPAAGGSSAPQQEADAAQGLEDVGHAADLSSLDLALPPSPPSGHFALLLTPQRLAWLCAGEAWRAAQGLAPALPARGARLGRGRGLAVWGADWRHRDLIVLVLRAESAEGVRALVRRACAVARQAQLQRVRIWDTFTGAVAGALGEHVGWRERRVGKLPMLAPPLAAAGAGAAPALSAAAWLPPERGLWY